MGRDLDGIGKVHGVRASPTVVIHSTGALVMLVAASVLAVYKPVGMTRREHRFRTRSRTTA